MNRLRVGDIDIRGRQVTIQATGSQDGREVRSSGADRFDLTAAFLLSRASVRARTFLLAGGGGGLAGSLMIFAGLQTASLTLVLGGVVALSIGVAAVGVGVIKHILDSRPHLLQRAALGPNAPHYVAELMKILSQVDKKQTVEWIVAQTGWTEEVVVRALGLLVRLDDVSEQFDADKQVFYYVAMSAFMPRDLSARARDLRL